MTSASDEKKCPFCAEAIKRDAVICRFCNKELNQKSPGKLSGTKRGALAGTLLLFAAIIYFYWTPFAALHELRQSLRNNQPDKVDQLVDYPAVRAGLKRDLHALAVGEVENDPSIKNKILGALGLALGAAVGDPTIDYVVSPAGLREVLSGVVPIFSHSRFDSDSAEPVDPDTAKASFTDDNIKKTECHYADFNHVLATISNRSGSATILTFTRSGLAHWQLTHIRFIPVRD